MPGRKFTAGKGYRYGFNGKENDNEVKGEGNQQDYGLRIYDTRLGRFLSVDPLVSEFPWNSPYSYAEGNPINFIDLDGAETPTLPAQSTLGRSSLPMPSYPRPGLQAYTNSLAPNPYQTVADYQNGFSAEDLKPDGTLKGNFLEYLGNNGFRAFQDKHQMTQPSGPVTIGPPGSKKETLTVWGKATLRLQAEFSKQFEIKTSPIVKPNSVNTTIAEPDDNTKKENDTYVYRAGGFTDMNFTPRPGIDDIAGPKSGLSAYTTALKATQGKGGKVQKLSVTALKQLGFVVNITPDGHAGIRPASQQELEEWAKTRPDVATGGTPHENTTAVKTAKVGQENVKKR